MYSCIILFNSKSVVKVFLKNHRKLFSQLKKNYTILFAISFSIFRRKTLKLWFIVENFMKI